MKFELATQNDLGFRVFPRFDFRWLFATGKIVGWLELRFKDRFQLSAWNYSGKLFIWVSRFSLVPGPPIGFRDEKRLDSTFPHWISPQGPLFRNLDFHWFPGPPMGYWVKLSSDSDSPWSITFCPSVPRAKVCFLVRIQKKNKLEVSFQTNFLS